MHPQKKGPSKDPIGDPSDPGAPSPSRPLVVRDEAITVLNAGVTALNIGSQTLNAQNPVLTTFNTPTSLALDGLQIGTSAYPFMNLTPTPARDVFTIGRESFTLKFQGIAVDGTPLRVGGPALTVDGTRVSLGPSELVVGNKTETFTPATGDPLVEINGVKGGAGAGVGAGTKGIAETSAGAGAGLGSALMSGLGAIGGGAATPTNGSGPGGNGRAAAPFSGTASKVGDGANLWVRIGSGFWVVRCLIGV